MKEKKKKEMYIEIYVIPEKSSLSIIFVCSKKGSRSYLVNLSIVPFRSINVHISVIINLK